MVSRLDDRSKAAAKAREVQSFLEEELLLPLGVKPSYARTFAAFLGLLRSCNPLHTRLHARDALKVRCPLVRRFPEVLTGKLLWYKDVEVGLHDVVDRGGPHVDVHKMWRMMIWIWLGNGGRLHKAWKMLECK